MSNANLSLDTPRHISTGAQDNSGGSIPYEQQKRSLHVPLYYGFAPKGKPSFYGTSAEHIEMYTADAFDKTGPYATHVTLLRNFLIENGDPNGGAGVFRRVIPKDNVTPANVAVWVDVLETMVPNYERNSDGSFYLDEVGKTKVISSYVKGVRLKWYKKSVTGAFDLGQLKPQEGSMSKWTIGAEETESHIISTDYDIESSPSGHLEYANKTVYVYSKLEDLHTPVFGSTVRKMYTVDDSGNRTHGPEEQTYGVTPGVTTKSKLYPIFEVKASYLGSWYNLTGFSFESLFGDKAPEDIITNNKWLPFNFSLYVKPNDRTTGKILRNVNGENASLFTFQPKSMDPVTGTQNGFEYTTMNLLFNETSPEKVLIYRFFEGIKFYRQHFESLLSTMNDNESKFVSSSPTSWKDDLQAASLSWYDYPEESDITTAYGLMNPMTCLTSKKVDLQTAILDTDAPTYAFEDGSEEIAIGSNAPIYLANGEDGTMTDEIFEELVREDLDNYLDEDHVYQDLSLSYETHLYDSGFEIETKKKLGQMMALRKDTVVNGSTICYSDRHKNTSIEKQRNIGSILVAGAKIYPESQTYGTPAMRFTCTIGNGQYEDYDYRFPATFDLAVKTALLMGGNNQKFNSQKLFDCGYEAIVHTLSDVEPKFIPPSIKNGLRKTGLNYWECGGTPNEYFYPQIQTVYSDKTSIANSYLNVLVVAACERVAWQVWRELVGDTRSTISQFAEKGRSLAAQKVTGMFDGLVKVIPEFYITEADKQRGYTWHLEYKIYGNVSKRVQVYTSKLYRSEALEEK